MWERVWSAQEIPRDVQPVIGGSKNIFGAKTEGQLIPTDLGLSAADPARLGAMVAGRRVSSLRSQSPHNLPSRLPPNLTRFSQPFQRRLYFFRTNPSVLGIHKLAEFIKPPWPTTFSKNSPQIDSKSTHIHTQARTSVTAVSVFAEGVGLGDLWRRFVLRHRQIWLPLDPQGTSCFQWEVRHQTGG